MTMASAPGGPSDHSDPAALTCVQESPLFVDLPAVGESQSCDCGIDQDVVVVNELLCFVTNKIDVMTQDVLVKLCADHRGIRHRVLTNQRDRSYVYAVVSLAAGGPFVGGPIVTYIFSRVSVGSACVRVWKRGCDVTSLVEHHVKSLQQNGP